MAIDFSDFNFKYGKAFIDANVYEFENPNKNMLRISQKVGHFQEGDTSRYLKFDYKIDNIDVCQYVDRTSDEYRKLNNISAIIENYGGIVSVCKGCNRIVLTEQLTNSNSDACCYCDLYTCKKCRKLFTLSELDDNRLCRKCRGDK